MIHAYCVFEYDRGGRAEIIDTVSISKNHAVFKPHAITFQ